jgi:hypothetical protein
LKGRCRARRLQFYRLDGGRRPDVDVQVAETGGPESRLKLLDVVRINCLALSLQRLEFRDG